MTRGFAAPRPVANVAVSARRSPSDFGRRGPITSGRSISASTRRPTSAASRWPTSSTSSPASASPSGSGVPVTPTSSSTSSNSSWPSGRPGTPAHGQRPQMIAGHCATGVGSRDDHHLHRARSTLGEPLRRVVQRSLPRQCLNVEEFGDLPEAGSLSKTGESSTTPAGRTRPSTASPPPSSLGAGPTNNTNS